jgi:hypothetical protein
MIYKNNAGRLGCWLHQCVLGNMLAGSMYVVSISRIATVVLLLLLRTTATTTMTEATTTKQITTTP